VCGGFTAFEGELHKRGGKVPRHGGFVACLTAARCVSGHTACGRDANYTLHCCFEVVQVVDLEAGQDCRRAILRRLLIHLEIIERQQGWIMMKLIIQDNNCIDVVVSTRVKA
jgi:hypothetical protein